MNPTIVVPPHDVTPGPGRPDRRRLAHRERAHYRLERARLRREERGPVHISLWLPTTVLFTILAPFALLLLPFLYLAPRRVLPNPLLALLGVGRLLLSVSGTDIDVDTPDAKVRLRFF